MNKINRHARRIIHWLSCAASAPVLPASSLISGTQVRGPGQRKMESQPCNYQLRILFHLYPHTVTELYFSPFLNPLKQQLIVENYNFFCA